MEEELYEAFRYAFMTICQAIRYVLNKHIVIMHHELVQHQLTKQPRNINGYDYIHRILNEDP